MGSKKCCVSNNNSANAFLDFPDGGPSLSLTYALVASSDRVLVVGWNPRIRELEITSEVIEPVPQAAAFSMCQRRLRKTHGLLPHPPREQRRPQAFKQVWKVALKQMIARHGRVSIQVVRAA